MMFKSVRVPKTGGAEVLKLVTEPFQEKLGPKQVLVRRSLCGVNFIDTYFRSGLYPTPTPKLFGDGSFICGTEGVGIAEAIGEEISSDKFKAGDRVCFFTQPNKFGAYASVGIHEASELINVTKATRDLGLKRELEDREVVGALIQGMTAHYLTTSCWKIEKGKTVVLVNAAAGGTGLLVTQVAKKILGAKTVIGICGGKEKCELSRAVGKTDFQIDYKAEGVDWVQEVKKLTADHGGVDIFYDGVGQSTVEANGMSVLKRRGSFCTFGNASGAIESIKPLTLTSLGSVTLQRPKLFDFVDKESGELDLRIKDVFSWIADDKLKLTFVPTKFTLETAADAQALLESGKSTGKIVIDCSAV